jgi:hypothetical protein
MLLHRDYDREKIGTDHVIDFVNVVCPQKELPLGRQSLKRVLDTKMRLALTSRIQCFIS